MERPQREGLQINSHDVARDKKRCTDHFDPGTTTSESLRCRRTRRVASPRLVVSRLPCTSAGSSYVRTLPVEARTRTFFSEAAFSLLALPSHARSSLRSEKYLVSLTPILLLRGLRWTWTPINPVPLPIRPLPSMTFLPRCCRT